MRDDVLKMAAELIKVEANPESFSNNFFLMSHFDRELNVLSNICKSLRLDPSSTPKKYSAKLIFLIHEIFKLDFMVDLIKNETGCMKSIESLLRTRVNSEHGVSNFINDIYNSVTSINDVESNFSARLDETYIKSGTESASLLQNIFSLEEDLNREKKRLQAVSEQHQKYRDYPKSVGEGEEKVSWLTAEIKRLDQLISAGIKRGRATTGGSFLGNSLLSSTVAPKLNNNNNNSVDTDLSEDSYKDC